MPQSLLFVVAHVYRLFVHLCQMNCCCFVKEVTTIFLLSLVWLKSGAILFVSLLQVMASYLCTQAILLYDACLRRWRHDSDNACKLLRLTRCTGSRPTLPYCPYCSWPSLHAIIECTILNKPAIQTECCSSGSQYVRDTVSVRLSTSGKPIISWLSASLQYHYSSFPNPVCNKRLMLMPAYEEK